MLAFFATMIVLLLSAYYLLSVQKQKAKEEAKKKKEAAAAAQKKKEEEEERQLLLKNRKKKKPIQQQKKKQKQQQEKPHDPSSNERYIRRFGGHQRDISAIALSPNGEWMATTCVDGQLRVARVEKDSNNNMFVTTTIPDHDKAVAMSWEADNRTIACVLDRNNEIAFFRIRKKQQAADSAFPYELIELVKRRFSTDDKYDKITACVTDQTSALFHLVLLSGDSPSRPKAKTITAWDGMTGQFLQTLSTGSLNNGNVRVSKDAKFVAGRCHGACNEVKLFEIVKKRHKGEVEPQFDTLSAKSVMTLTVGKKVQDVDFLYDAGNEHACDKAVVCCTDGTMQIWNLNVEYRQQQDPKLIHELSCEGVFLNKDIVSLATNRNNHQIAVATAGSSIHLFAYDDNKKKDITYNFSMEECHGRKGIEDVCFGNNNNDNVVLYSKGTTSKDVFSWNVAV